MNNPNLPMYLAQARQDDLHRARARQRLESETTVDVTPERRVPPQFGRPGSEHPLTSPAALDGTAPGAQQILLAEVDGELRTALVRFDGTVCGDPFHPRVGLIELLRDRAQPELRARIVPSARSAGLTDAGARRRAC